MAKGSVCGGVGSSPLEVAEAAFRGLCEGPAPYVVPLAEVGGLAEGALPVGEVRRLLTSGRAGGEVCDGVWARLLGDARSRGGAAMVVAVGCALPGLRRVAGVASRGLSAVDRDEVDAEVLAGFLERMASVELDAPGIFSRLLWAARRAASRAVAARSGVPVAEGVEAAAPVLPAGHPDLVLDRLVALGVISAGEADLVGCTRLEGVSLAEAAFCLGVSYTAARLRRWRAEARIAAALREEDTRSCGPRCDAVAGVPVGARPSDLMRVA